MGNSLTGNSMATKSTNRSSPIPNDPDPNEAVITNEGLFTYLHPQIDITDSIPVSVAAVPEPSTMLLLSLGYPYNHA